MVAISLNRYLHIYVESVRRVLVLEAVWFLFVVVVILNSGGLNGFGCMEVNSLWEKRQEALAEIHSSAIIRC